MRLSQKAIIEALQTEPLRPGNWVCMWGNDAAAVKCDVCAVGAILRRARWDDGEIDEYGYDLVGDNYCNTDSYQAALKEKDYLGALSTYFETICPSAGATPAIRKRLVAFVKKHFPKTLTIKKPE